MVVIYLPLTLAFSNYGEPVWQFVIDVIIIVLFIIDLVLNFFIAYYDKREIVIVDEHKVSIFSLTLLTENSKTLS